MTTRIDFVELHLDVFDDSFGRREVVVPYKPTGSDDPFIAAVREKWNDYIQGLTVQAKNASNEIDFG